MKIGIDIDNTLTDIERDMFKAACEYTKRKNKDFVKPEFVKYDGITNMAQFYSRIFNWDDNDILQFFKNDRIKVVDNAKVRKNAAEVIKKLKEDGNNIYVITARTNKFDDRPYDRAKEWLDKNNIEYDKLVVGANDKADTCRILGVKLFIDDQLNHCMNLAKNGIITIRLTNSKEIYEDFVSISNWKDVYNYILKIKEEDIK